MTDSATELQQLVDVLPQYEDQIRYWESQLEAISNVRADILQAQETLNGMLDSDKEMEMMVPVGHNTSIFTTVKDPDRILVGLGSGSTWRPPVPIRWNASPNASRVWKRLVSLIRKI